jgi:isovaleryl-CoA dehydrogenase
MVFRAACRAAARPQRQTLSAFAPQRWASSKHPSGFVPPTEEDLAELREQVREFARLYSGLADDGVF